MPIKNAPLNKVHILGNFFISSRMFLFASFAAIAGALFIKNPSIYLTPAFLPDDIVLFQYHFNHREPGSFIYYWMGYFSLFPNLVAKISVSILPVTWIPRAFAISCLLTTATMYWMLCLPPFAAYVSDPKYRFFIALMIAIQPIGSWAIQGSLMWQHWNLVCMIFLIVLMEPHIKRITYAGLSSLILLLCIFSTPLCVIFFPVFLIRCIHCFRLQQKIRALLFCILSASVIGYVFFFTAPMDFEIQYSIAETARRIISFILPVSFQRLMFDSFFPPVLRITAPLGILPMAVSMSMLLLSVFLLVSACRKNPNIVFPGIFTLYIVIATTLFMFIRVPYFDNIVYREIGFRYFYVQQFSILFLFLICVFQLVYNKLFLKRALAGVVFSCVLMSAALEHYRFQYIVIRYNEYKELKNSSRTDHTNIRVIKDEGQKLAECLQKVQNRLLHPPSDNLEQHVVCEEIEVPFRLNIRAK